MNKREGSKIIVTKMMSHVYVVLSVYQELLKNFIYNSQYNANSNTVRQVISLSYVIDEEIDTQRGWVTCPRLHSSASELGSNHLASEFMSVHLYNMCPKYLIPNPSI